MKKILLMLALMLPCLGAWAQNATTHADGVYKIFWQWNGRGYLTYHADYPNDPQLAGVTLGNYGKTHYQLTDEGIQLYWYLYTSPNTGKTYLFETTTGKFITIDLTTTVGNGKKCILSTEVTTEAQLDLKATTNTEGYMLSYNNYNLCSGCGSVKGDNPVRFATDGQTDGGIPFVFVSEGTINDEVKNAAIAKINTFEQNRTSYTIKSVNRGFLYYDEANAGFVTSSSHTDLIDATPTGLETEQFAILHSDNIAKNEYYLYSKSAGQFLTYVSGDIALQLTDNPVHTWVVEAASKGTNTGFTIKVPETTQTYINITNWLAKHGCKVTSTGVDEGNLMTINAVATDVDFTAALTKIQTFEAAERERVMTEIDGLLESTAPFLDPTKVDGGIGAYSYELYICLAYAASNYNLADLKNVVKEYRNSLVLPVAGKFLRIKAVAGWNDDAPYLGANNSTTQTTRAEFVTDADKNTIFYYDGRNLVSFGSGNYLVMDSSSMLGYNGVQTEGSKIAFHLASNDLIGAYNISFNNGGRWLYADKNNYTNAGGRGTEYGYCFNLEEVTEIPVTISAAKFASFYAPVAMTVPEGVTAYYINSSKVVNGVTWATLEEIDNDVIPANTGVILYSETPNTYNLTVGGEATAIENNWLTGTAASTYISEESYVLSNKSGIGLYIADKEGNTTWLNNGFKAYLPVSATGTTSNVLRFTFGGNTTAIESVLNNDADANAPIYDLTGRRVMNTVKGGIYIQNGKKFIVK